ncbi:hypothetical protein VMCG_07850 [Cytospora schulzeri]|uniref:Uncharacterized protein n=1 Tax=Cytospora schulzeri TaxID=448051 RepID=A0A423W0K1_9PEZI|nr:hypothetical protein VMCG_07850 [Valsa malicola]
MSTEITMRINANASKIWGGDPSSYELDFETDDYEYWSCVLKEEIVTAGNWKTSKLKLRMMTPGNAPSTNQAVRELDRILQDMAESKERKTREAKANAPSGQ